MRKLAFFPVLLIAACVVAAIYGAIQNEITFAVAPEYFNHDVFDKHNRPNGKRGHSGAAYVGIVETWWLGLAFGAPVVGFAAAFLPSRRAYVKHSLIGIALVAAVALLIGVVALLVAAVVLSESSLRDYWFPPGVTDRVAFASAGAMRDFALLGGCVGVFVAWMHLLAVRKRILWPSRRKRLAIDQAN